MLATIHVILMMFALIALGSILSRMNLPVVGHYSVDFWREAGRLCYSVCLPVLVFLGTTQIKWGGELASLAAMTAIAMIVLAVVILAFCLLLPFPTKTKLLIGILSFNPSSAFLGIPLAVGLFGPGIVAKAALISAVEAGLATAIAIFILSGDTVRQLRQIATRICVDPLILSTILGFGCSAVGFQLPDSIQRAVQPLASMTIPLALLAVGANIRVASSDSTTAVLWVVFLKLVFAPLIVGGLFYATNYQGQDAFLVLLLLSAPVALVTTVFVERYTGDRNLTIVAANSVSFTAICSAASIPIVARVFWWQ